jgi:hypothetical protein
MKKKPMRKKWTSGLHGRRRRGGKAEPGPVIPVVRSSFFCFHLICKGDPYPENSAQRTLGVEDFLCMG